MRTLLGVEDDPVDRIVNTIKKVVKGGAQVRQIIDNLQLSYLCRILREYDILESVVVCRIHHVSYNASFCNYNLQGFIRVVFILNRKLARLQ